MFLVYRSILVFGFPQASEKQFNFEASLVPPQEIFKNNTPLLYSAYIQASQSEYYFTV